MALILESVPNFSEGRNQATLSAIGAALSVNGVRLLDVQSDADHNRSVFTLVGESEALVEGLLAGIRVALAEIDLNTHQGAHPRLGAVDVVPFIPLLDTDMSVAVEAGRSLGQQVAGELDLPVYFYEESATRPDRRNLEQIRGKGFEELRDLMESDDSKIPDLGPRRIHPTAGAVVIGARRPLIAYNIYLSTKDVSVAQAIAKAVRHSSGGLRYVKAMGFNIPERGCVQVSMNLTNFERTSLGTVFAMVADAAAAYGVNVTDSEVVGMLPAEALIDVARRHLRMHEFRTDQVLELRLLESGVSDA